VELGKYLKKYPQRMRKRVEKILKGRMNESRVDEKEKWLAQVKEVKVEG